MVLRDAGVLAGRHLRLAARRPASVVSALAAPVVFTVLFLTVFGPSMGAVGVDYPQFLLPAVMVQAVFFTAMAAAVIAAEDSSAGLVGRLRAMPVGRAAPVLGLVGASVVRGALSMVVLVGLGAPVGFRLSGRLLATLGFVMLALGFAVVTCLGFVLLGSVAGRVDAASAMSQVVYFPLLLLSSAFSPASAFPAGLSAVVVWQPVSAVADALRALAFPDPGSGPLLVAVAWLVGLGLVFGLLLARRTR